MIRNWLRIFTFQLRQNKLFTALNILGLSIGISGLLFAILYWNDETAYDAWNPKKDSTYLVVNDLGDMNKWAVSSAPTGPTLLQFTKDVQSYVYFSGYGSDKVTVGKKAETVEKTLSAQANFFSFFPFEFVEGNPQTALRDESAVAISEALARRFFGDEKALGKRMTFGKQTYTVQGVYRVPGKSSVAPDLVANTIEQRLREAKDDWGNFSYNLLLQIDDPSAVPSVKKAFDTMYYENRTKKYAKAAGLTPEEFIKKEGRENPVILEKLADARLHSIVQGYPEGTGNYRFLMVMMALSILILVLSIVNYVNMTTANALSRAREVGVRKVLGSTRSGIVWQFLMEAAILTAFAILLSLAIVELALPYYNDFLQKQLSLSGTLFALELVGIFTIVVAIAGIFPAIYVSKFQTLKVLKGNFGRSRNGMWLRNGMLVLQFAIASFFIVGSNIVNEQINYMSTKDLGFRGDQVLQVTFRNDYDWHDSLYIQKINTRMAFVKERIARIDGVKGVAAGAFNFEGGATSSSSFSYNNTEVQGENMATDFGMFDILSVDVVKGRDLSPKFASDTVESILVNETALRMMREPNPIGKVVKWNNYQLRIVGIAKDFHTNSMTAPIKPMVFMHFKTVDWMAGNANRFYIRIDPEKTELVVAGLEKLWKTMVSPGYPFEYDFVDKVYARTYRSFVLQRNLFLLLNITVIVIALFGLFALASYSMERRMKEIAIRKTLGADTKSLLMALSKQYLVFCGIGFILAFFPTRIVLSEWLNDFAYRIDITFVPFLAGFLVLTALTLLIVLVRAYRATRVDVLKYLKYE